MSLNASSEVSGSMQAQDDARLECGGNEVFDATWSWACNCDNAKSRIDVPSKMGPSPRNAEGPGSLVFRMNKRLLSGKAACRHSRMGWWRAVAAQSGFAAGNAIGATADALERGRQWNLNTLQRHKITSHIEFA